MSTEDKYLQERIKKKFVADYIDNCKNPDLYGVNSEGKFLVNMEFTSDEMKFIILNFDSQEEWEKAFLDEIDRRVEDLKENR